MATEENSLKDQKLKWLNMNNMFEDDNKRLRTVILQLKSTNNKINITNKLIKESLQKKIKTVYELKIE